ncbi:CRP/FNR family transcriptional regulator, anaerobic regulatory protein [Loktanella sp. DSM 29012]|uniref:Crp/Fnr family transcriptional regulator n=1 Tax=Loktanella gaetbuli TaxID=2881335 RepID=A0ABS8BRR6_9RHOB|nr:MULTISPECIES: Crp/Fnr family transcriptional regulator [Loktanella]MCB5198423.1 Crp/Fnr family transcriptional regulator [Loktanella gaetbuli]SEQ54498.1 CRP/FNR family transcriptional regulator, anaerobic regulatory protein [Loktanella sp. DSM 29012]
MKVEDWTARFQGTAALPRDVRDRLQRSAQTVRYAAGKSVFGPSNIPDSLMFLVDGTIRVSQTSENGRDIVLYRVEAGESCVLTTACMLAEEAYNAEGIAETDVTAIILPRASFDQLVSEEPAFRSFVFAAYSRRLIDLLRVVDDVAFGRIDVRLAERLLGLARDDQDIATTHQQLASELGTAREVISRVLQDFAKRGLISQTRGHVTLKDRAGLRAIAQG